MKCHPAQLTARRRGGLGDLWGPPLRMPTSRKPLGWYNMVLQAGIIDDSIYVTSVVVVVV